MSVVPEIKSPLEEKIVVKPILWTMYHIHAYQGPCRYGQGYALTTESRHGSCPKRIQSLP